MAQFGYAVITENSTLELFQIDTLSQKYKILLTAWEGMNILHFWTKARHTISYI